MATQAERARAFFSLMLRDDGSTYDYQICRAVHQPEFAQFVGLEGVQIIGALVGNEQLFLETAAGENIPVPYSRVEMGTGGQIIVYGPKGLYDEDGVYLFSIEPQDRDAALWTKAGKLHETYYPKT